MHGHTGRLWTCRGGGNKRTPDGGSFPRCGGHTTEQIYAVLASLCLLPRCAVEDVWDHPLPVFVLPNGLKQLLLLWGGLAPPTSSLLSLTPAAGRARRTRPGSLWTPFFPRRKRLYAFSFTQPYYKNRGSDKLKIASKNKKQQQKKTENPPTGIWEPQGSPEMTLLQAEDQGSDSRAGR